MTDQRASHHPPSALDDLVSQLLDCGGVLSQIISRMVQFNASGRAAPDIAPIPVVAHSLIHDTITDLAEQYSEEEIRTSASVIKDVTQSICANIFFVGPELN